MPLQYHGEGLDDEVLRAFGIDDAPAPSSTRWTDIMDRVDHPEGEVTIGVVGKYVALQDAYKSLREALTHGGLANRVKVNIRWIDAEVFERDDVDLAAELEPLHGILVPGGFGERGSEGKIASVRFAREQRVPFFGICLGMQMACIEGARNTAGIAVGLDHRVRRDQRAGGRPDHRVDGPRRPAEAQRRHRPWRHHAARRLRGGARPQQQGRPAIWRRRRSPSATATATRSTSTIATRSRRAG